LLEGTDRGIFEVFRTVVVSTWSDLLKVATRALVALLLTAACAPEATPTMERDAFIDVMIQLRQAQKESEDEAAFAVRRDEILEATQVTDSMLIAFARIQGRDPGFMAAVWDSIDRVVNNVTQEEDELGPDVTGPR
jgi:hypothetical protein